jgi:LacI family transcriptional regulator
VDFCPSSLLGHPGLAVPLHKPFCSPTLKNELSLYLGNPRARVLHSRINSGATITSVAEAAKVSKTTVSHVLSGKRPVSQATRRNVLRIMEELGFQPNYFAQALIANRSLAVALIVQDLTNPYYPLLGRGLQFAIGQAGYVVMLFDGAAQPEAAEAAVKTAIQRRVDGVVIATAGVERAAPTLRQAGIATVAVGSGPAIGDLDWVSADDERIAYDAVAHLLKSGRRRIAAITGPIEGSPGFARLKGYHAAMTDGGAAVDKSLIIGGGWTRDGGAAAMRVLLQQSGRPTAVFCANDVMAIGALDVALGLGVKVPDDLAIVGVDDIEAAALLRPSLTTVRLPTLEIGRTAGTLLLDRLAQGATAPARHILVQHSLMVRQSA